MKSNHSKILVYATLVILASFLVFWLFGEYKKEKKNLEVDMDLAIAKELMEIGGMDLNKFLSQFGDNKANVSFVIGVEDSVMSHSHLDGKTNPYHNLDTQSPIIIDINDTTQSINREIRYSFSTSPADSTALYNFERPSFFSKDSVETHIIHSRVKEMKSDYEKEKEGINQTALINIWTKILFAFLLFGFMTTGIYFLQKGYQEKQILLENKNNLISNITHELQTPIATISVALEAIQDFNVKEDKEKTKRYINTSRDELKRLSSIVDQVLQLSKMDKNKVKYSFSNIDINALLVDIAQVFQLQFENKNTKFNIHSDTDQIFASVDQAHFKNLLFNLIDNSLKYGKKGVEINCHLKQDDTNTYISIEDNGIGIPTKYKDKVFDRFFRVPDGNRHNVSGYGLGLSYVQEIVHAHKGKIELQSQENKGTQISIKIPREQNV